LLLKVLGDYVGFSKLLYEPEFSDFNDLFPYSYRAFFLS